MKIKLLNDGGYVTRHRINFPVVIECEPVAIGEHYVEIDGDTLYNLGFKHRIDLNFYIENDIGEPVEAVIL